MTETEFIQQAFNILNGVLDEAEREGIDVHATELPLDPSEAVLLGGAIMANEILNAFNELYNTGVAAGSVPE